MKNTITWKSLLTVTVAAGLAVCSSVTHTAEQPASDLDSYRIAAGDTVRVTVYGHGDLSGEFEVGGDGRISLPLIQRVDAAGYSASELAAEIEEQLRPDYLKDPKVSVEVIAYRPVFVLGEVREPGSYPYSTGMTVVKAIALAGGYTYRGARNKIVLTRKNEANENRQRIDEQDALMPGDVIEVPERFF